MIAVLQIWRWYRQRFYLDGKAERGFHWRAGVLQLAKWPYQLAAFGDVIIKRQLPYMTTPKIGGFHRRELVLWPHMATIGVIGFAWGLGLNLHSPLPLTIQLCAGVILFVTFGLLVTEWSMLPKRIVKR
jgi:hypothetical protein